MSQTEMIPPGLERVLTRFRAMGREEKMASLVAYAKKLEPLPAHLAPIAPGVGGFWPRCAGEAS